mgnify:CR=1 FL=1
MKDLQWISDRLWEYDSLYEDMVANNRLIDNPRVMQGIQQGIGEIKQAIRENQESFDDRFKKIPKNFFGSLKRRVMLNQLNALEAQGYECSKLLRKFENLVR